MLLTQSNTVLHTPFHHFPFLFALQFLPHSMLSLNTLLGFTASAFLHMCNFSLPPFPFLLLLPPFLPLSPFFLPPSPPSLQGSQYNAPQNHYPGTPVAYPVPSPVPGTPSTPTMQGPPPYATPNTPTDPNYYGSLQSLHQPVPSPLGNRVGVVCSVMYTDVHPG